MIYLMMNQHTIDCESYIELIVILLMIDFLIISYIYYCVQTCMTAVEK